MSKKIFKLSGLHCVSCATNIEWELEDKGLVAKCNYAKQTLEVEIGSENKDQVIKETVEKLGYKVEE